MNIYAIEVCINGPKPCAIFDFPWSRVFGNLDAFEKANLAKLVMQVSDKEGEPEPVWNQAVSFFMNQDFKDCL